MLRQALSKGYRGIPAEALIAGSIDEVADIVGIPLSTVKTRMFYARKHLAVVLAAVGIDRAAM